MTLRQDNTKKFSHGQELCEILSKSNIIVMSYRTDKDHDYVCSVTLTSDMWPWVKVMTHPWVMEIIIQIQQNSRYLLLRHWFSRYVNCDIDLGDTSVGQGLWLCAWCDLDQSYGMGKYQGYVCYQDPAKQ